MVVHVRDMEVGRGQLAPGAVYIGRAVPRRGYRASKWANPYRLSQYMAEECLRLFRAHVLETPSLRAALPELVGKRLACWCKRKGDEPCHGDVLVQLLRELSGHDAHERYTPEPAESRPRPLTARRRALRRMTPALGLPPRERR